MKCSTGYIFLFFCIIGIIPAFVSAQNVGIGTSNPQARLHVDGSFKLQNGVIVNGISADSNFTAGSDSLLPTQKAIKRYLQKASWLPQAGKPDSLLVFNTANNITLSSASSLAVQGNYAYVTSVDENQLCIFDISIPDTIIAKDTISANLFTPVSVVVQGNYAYVASRQNNRLCIYDISNPNNIVAKGFTSTNIVRPWSVFVAGSYAYVTSGATNALSIFDISNPDNIVPNGTTSNNLSFPESVFVKGNYAYVASGSNNRLCIFDISNPNTIIAKGVTSTNLTGPSSVFVSGEYAYVASSGNSRLCIFDVSDPDAIIAKGFTSVYLQQPNAVFVKDNYAWVTNLDNDLVCAYDISDPNSIVFKWKAGDNLDLPNDVFAAGNEIYVTSSSLNPLSRFQLKPTPGSNMVAANAAGELVFTPALWQTDGNGTIFSSSGSTPVPTSTVHVRGNQMINGSLEVGAQKTKESNAGKIGYQIFSPNALDVVGAGTTAANRKIKFWAEGGTEFTGNVGIGTSNPSTSLHVTGSIRTNGQLIADDSIKIKAIVEEPVQSPVLQNGWVNHGSDFANSGYWKDKEGIVHIQGLIRSGITTNGTVLFVLPAGYRPPQRLIFTVNSNNIFCRVDILFTGEVIIAGTAFNNFLNLTGIYFRVD